MLVYLRNALTNLKIMPLVLIILLLLSFVEVVLSNFNDVGVVVAAVGVLIVNVIVVIWLFQGRRYDDEHYS